MAELVPNICPLAPAESIGGGADDGGTGTSTGSVDLKGLTFTADTSSTADADPGNGVLRWNNATQPIATTLFIDNLTADGVAINTFFAALSPIGFIYLQQSDDATKWQLWRWTAVTAGSGYYKFTVTLMGGGGSIATGKTILCQFDCAPSATPKYTRGAAWQNQGSAIVASDANVVYRHVHQSGTITKWVILTDVGTGSCQIDVWKDTYANYPPTVADTITAASKPNVPSGVKASDTVLTGWTTSVTAGDVLAFKLESSTTFKYISIDLEITPL